MAALRQLGLSPHLRLVTPGARMISTSRALAVQSSRARLATAPVPAASQSYIKGTVNEPTTFPEPHAAHGSYHWMFERATSVALIPLFAAGAVKHGASGILDATIAMTLVVHSHIGFVVCWEDYLHTRKFPIAGPTVLWGLRAATLATLAGIYEFQTNDVGFTELIARVWTA